MKKKFRRSLFLFRRDLRLEDNRGLLFALKNSDSVIPAFIFTPEQIENNPYRSDHCLQFMIQSLQDLEIQLNEKNGRLYLFKGDNQQIVEKCITELKIDALVLNRDYTPYSRQRDEKLENTCKKHNKAFYSFDDALLLSPEESIKKDGKPYTIFTPFFRNASKSEVEQPIQNEETNYFKEPIPFSQNSSLYSTITPQQTLHNNLKGGRKEALKILKNLSNFTHYENLRNFPAENYSTQLSPYLKFTNCSPREVHAAISRMLNPHHALIRALYWRDFFTTIAFFFPHVFKSSFHPKFDPLKWSYDENLFKRWCEGTTGFPIVDAGMREMNETGFMHNRVRMIAASFLVKDLHINWRWGEKYFAQNLVDYDPAVNNGNWQWVASTGCDAQPYFRIFNPWNQQKKFDPLCAYIKKWVPELKDFSPKLIHAWDGERGPHYARPIVIHEKESKVALEAYRSLSFFFQQSNAI